LYVRGQDVPLSRVGTGASRRSRVVRRVRGWGIGAIVLMASSACSTPGAVAGPVDLSCTIEGAKLLSPAMTDDAICGEIKREIDAGLSRQTRSVKSVASTGSADWININLRFMQPGTASAAVTQRIGKREIAHPEIAVDIMDRPLGPKEVRRLAAEVARAIVKSTQI
jgi:hypothetical protein